MKKLVLIGAVLVSAATAFAQSQPTRRVGPDNDLTRVICQTQRETGSLTRSTRVCKTRAQWDADRQQNREQAEKVQQYKVTVGQ